jgi:hypothetical protein
MLSYPTAEPPKELPSPEHTHAESNPGKGADDRCGSSPAFPGLMICSGSYTYTHIFF